MEHFDKRPVIYMVGNHEYSDQRMDRFEANARASAAGTNVHSLGAEECTFHGARLLGATSWTELEVTIGTPTEPRCDARAHAHPSCEALRPQLSEREVVT